MLTLNRKRIAAIYQKRLRRRLVKFFCRAVTCLAGLGVIALSSPVSGANDVPIGLRTVWNFDQEGIARFCYDKVPAIIYSKYDVVNKVTSILRRELNGGEQVLAEFSGVLNSRSLSCSQDGQVIAAVDAEAKSLLILRGKSLALYKLSHFWAFSNVGLYSLISPDGKSIAIPEMPTLVKGPDLLKEMKVFSTAETHNVFFMANYAYVDGDDKIYKYGYANGKWDVQWETKSSRNFSLGEVAGCGDHDVATLVATDTSRFKVLGEDAVSKQDWLERIGARKLFRKFSNPILITGSYGMCAFPLRTHGMQLGQANGLARFDADGLELFSFPDSDVWIPADAVNFSKDGCYVLIGVPATRFLAVQSPRCQ